MWTAKRVLILMGGLLVSLSSFAIYTLFLGGIDGLPPLPTEYYPPPPGPQAQAITLHRNQADEKLEQAYGSGCEELRRPYRLWLPEKGIAFAAGQVDIEHLGGRVRLAPFSVALYHKTKVPGAYPEISTIRADVAFLTLDRPVSQFGELTNRKVIKVELQGKTPGISLINNRHTAEKSDDVDILITNGSLFFEERRNLIWTDGVVRLTDYQSKPPTVVQGKGLEMLLAKDSSASRPRNAKLQPAQPANDNGGIEQIILRTDVDMRFWVDARSSFLTGTQENKKPSPEVAAGPDNPQMPRDKAQIHIHTGGLFVYDLIKETAWFESPTDRDKIPKNDILPYPDHVHVQRFQIAEGKQKIDQLTCDRLDLQFRRKTDNAPANPSGPGGDKEIETATATSRPGPGNDVVLALDSDRLAAYGNYLFYRTGDAANGPQTLLKGEPLKSYKDGHVMVCTELRLIAANASGEGQCADAQGPGYIDMLDTRNPNPQKPVFSTHVRWRDKLLVVKDREGNQNFDLMKVYGEAAFIDDQQKQELYGDTILVWIINTQENNKKLQAEGGNKQELHRVLAQDHVRAASPEFIIPRTNRLTMTFLPELPQQDRLPEVKDPPSATVPTPVTSPPKENKTPAPAAKKEEGAKPRQPIELTGNEITVAISTLGTKKELQELIAKGNVFVYQAGEKKAEKRVDIQGHLLTVKHAEKGEILVVHGETKKLARVQLGEMIIWGPLVTINQGENRADVDGLGAMEMPSRTNLDGSKPNQGAPTRITIHWNKNMTFDGKYANFLGGVLAFQNGERSRVKCQELMAILDRFVSLKEGQKDKQDAQIDRLICNKKVYIEEVKIDAKEQLVQHSILQGQELSMFTQDGPTILVGPGTVRLLAKGSSDLAVAPPQQGQLANAKPDKQEWKLTRVEFPARMWSNSKASAKNAKFYAEPNSFVEVFHFPTVDINATMNADHPVKDGLFLRCEILTLEGRQNGAKTTQYMIAERNVFFRTEQYEGTADIVKFDESTDIIIFEATNGNRVKMSQFVHGQRQPMAINTSKVLYNRKTGQMTSDGVTSITNN